VGREGYEIGVKIAVDAMGGDHAPEVVVTGAVNAVSEHGFECALVGDESVLKTILPEDLSSQAIRDNISIVHAPEVVAMGDLPTQIIRKKQSSMAVAYRLVKDEKADAIFSAGNSGALVAGGRHLLGLIEGVEKPGLLITFPTLTGRDVIIIDAGAATDYRASELVVLARMGKVYAEEIMGLENPSIGLLNIGEEKFKGSDYVRKAHKLLGETELNFRGNIEGNAIVESVADIVVCDGFVGNTILKSAEGTFGFIINILKQEISRDFRSKIGALLLKPVFNRLKRRADWKERGGGVILGLKGNVFIGHGRSDTKAIQNGLRLAEKLGKADLWLKIQKELSAGGV